jgi:membrane-bound metal-dependent hydrolase YbcI (DUF457 family)
MFLLGHLGITLAAAQVLDGAVLSRRHGPTQEIQEAQQYEGVQSGKFSSISRIDVRLLLLGSILPDIIDKPLGHIILRNTLDNGRIYCHTLLFAIIISLAALCLWKYKHRTWLLPVAFGVFMHLVLDQMWLIPHTLLWPLDGLIFPEGYGNFWEEIVHELILDPGIYIPEIIGGLILLWVAILMIRKKHLHAFVRNGHL